MCISILYQYGLVVSYFLNRLNPLVLLILMFKLSQVWTVRTSSYWLLCPLEVAPIAINIWSIFYFLAQQDISGSLWTSLIMEQWFLSGALNSLRLSEDWHLDTKVWMLGVLTAMVFLLYVLISIYLCAITTIVMIVSCPFKFNNDTPRRCTRVLCMEETLTDRQNSL